MPARCFAPVESRKSLRHCALPSPPSRLVRIGGNTVPRLRHGARPRPPGSPGVLLVRAFGKVLPSAASRGRYFRVPESPAGEKPNPRAAVSTVLLPKCSPLADNGPLPHRICGGWVSVVVACANSAHSGLVLARLTSFAVELDATGVTGTTAPRHGGYWLLLARTPTRGPASSPGGSPGWIACRQGFCFRRLVWIAPGSVWRASCVCPSRVIARLASATLRKFHPGLLLDHRLDGFCLCQVFVR